MQEGKTEALLLTSECDVVTGGNGVAQFVLRVTAHITNTVADN